MKKSILSLSVVTFALLGLTACGERNDSTPTSTGGGGGGTGSAQTIVVSGPAEHESFIIGQLNALKAADTEFANVTFSYVVHGEDKVDSEVTDWNDGPDVYAYASDKILELNQKGALSQVPNAYASTINNMGEAAASVATLAGKLLAYPYAGDNGYFLYYDKSRLETTDVASIEGLLAKAATLNSKVGYPLKTAFYNMGALFTFGADYSLDLSDEGTIQRVNADFDGANGIKAGKAIIKITSHSAWQDSQAAPIAENGLVACVDGGWNAQTYQEAMGDNYACAKMPTVTIDGDTKTLGSFLGYKLYGVNGVGRSAEKLALSHKVANYLVSAQVQEARFDALSIAPTDPTVKALSKVQSAPAIAAIAAQSAYAHPQGAVPGTLWGCMDAFVTDMEAGKVNDTNMAEYMATVNNKLKSI